MHGTTNKEMAEFKRIAAVARSAKNKDDIMAVKAMCSEWVKSARSVASRQRRKGMVQCVRGSHAQFAEE